MANAWAAWPTCNGGSSSRGPEPGQITAWTGGAVSGGKGPVMKLSDAVPTATLLSLSAANSALVRLPNRPPTSAPARVGEGQKNGLD
jgi:hypothetical protein